MIAIKVLLSIFGLLLTLVAYTAAFAAITCAIHGAKATGWPALRNDPVFWLLLILFMGGELWLGARWVWR